MKTSLTYSLPIPPDTLTSVVRDSISHQGVYRGSIDFAVPLTTPVLAAADGVVTRVRDDSDRHGQDPIFGQDVNYITIEHKNNELSEYLHLALGSAKVKVGQKVRQGQQIAETGLSGWLYAPHLHLMVYQKTKNPQDFQCLEIQLRQPSNS